MNSRHPQGLGMITVEWQLQYELLRTWEEYYQLLIEIVSGLSRLPTVAEQSSEHIGAFTSNFGQASNVWT